MNGPGPAAGLLAENLEEAPASARRRAYWDERLREHWGLEGASSVVYGRRFARWRYRVRARVFQRVVRGLGVEPSRLDVLDVGCGTGFYLDQWRALGARSLAGLDISGWAVDQLRTAHPGALLVRGDIGGAGSPLPVEAFDAVSAIDVLVHLVDDSEFARALRHLHEALRPGGFLILSDSFFHGPEKQHEEYWKGRSLASAVSLLAAAGFDVVSRSPLSVLLSAPTDTRRRERNERLFDLAMAPVRKSEWAGWLAGALLYPLELLLVSTLQESPAIEIMVCRKAR